MNPVGSSCSTQYDDVIANIGPNTYSMLSMEHENGRFSQISTILYMHYAIIICVFHM